MRRKNRKSPPKTSLTGSLDGWANALGRERRTLERILVRNGVEVAPRKVYTAKDIYAGLFGDEQAERVRNLKADADRKEREAAVESGALFPMSELEAWLVEHYVIPMSNVFSGMPSAVDTRCNPERPEDARKAIEDFIEGTVKPALKAGLEKPKATK